LTVHFLPVQAQVIIVYRMTIITEF